MAGFFGKKIKTNQTKNSFEYLLIETAGLKGWAFRGESKCRVMGFNWDVGVDVGMEQEQRSRDALGAKPSCTVVSELSPLSPYRGNVYLEHQTTNEMGSMKQHQIIKVGKDLKSMCMYTYVCLYTHTQNVHIETDRQVDRLSLETK